MILLKNKDKKANIKIGNNIEIKDGNDFPFDLTLYGRSTQETSTNPVSPSPDYPSEIESISGYNLWDNNSFVTNIPSDNIVKTETGFNFERNDLTGGKYAYVTINAKANETYIFSLNGLPSTSALYLYKDAVYGTSLASSLTGILQYTFAEDTTAIFAIMIGSGDTSMNLTNILLTKGLTQDYYLPRGSIGLKVVGYEPYQSNTSSIDLQGNELCSLPNGTKDELVIENGIAIITKRIGKVVLDGSENWISHSYGTNSYSLQDVLTFNFDDTQIQLISNYFKGVSNADRTIGDNITYTISSREFVIRNTTFTSLSDFKTWLSTHNVEVLYELAESETINLGTVEMPHTYEGVSNITNSADTEMVVKYYKKFEFDKILRSGYNIDEQEYEIAKKQMANGKRKKILSSYIDCVIKIDLGLLDNKTYQEYKEQLEDGEYEYWSYKYNQYKKANFILTKPSITTEYAYDDDIGIDDMEITLEKSSDVS